MIRATAVVRRPAVRAEKVTDEIFLDHTARQRSRFAFTAEGGTQFLLDLPKPAALDDGDAVKLEDGRLVRVNAAPESLVEAKTAGPMRLLKVAWHLGNRHVATEVTENAVYFPDDAALVEAVRGLGAAVARVTRPFRPEKGAQEAADAHAGHAHDHHTHAHDHGHHHHGDDGHAHHGEACGCGHDHDHAHDPAAHVHGPGCGHDHGHR